jgi:MFS family permease
MPSPSRWTLAATILGSSMTFIDATVVNVALPALQRDLHATITDVQWVIEAYALFLGALILLAIALFGVMLTQTFEARVRPPLNRLAPFVTPKRRDRTGTAEDGGRRSGAGVVDAAGGKAGGPRDHR